MVGEEWSWFEFEISYALLIEKLEKWDILSFLEFRKIVSEFQMLKIELQDLNYIDEFVLNFDWFELCFVYFFSEDLVQFIFYYSFQLRD